MNINYYVYIYLDPRKPGHYEYEDLCFLYEPFYVGKGKNGRYLEHIGIEYLKSDTLKTRKIKKILEKYKIDDFINYIVKIKHFDDESECFEYEKMCINNIGRMIKKEGPLVNILEGGEGGGGENSSGYIYVSKEVRIKIVDMYIREKMYMIDIGKIFNLNESKIKSVLVEENVTIRKKEPKNKMIFSDELKKQILYLYQKELLSIRKISKKLNISNSSINRLLKERKIKIRMNDIPKTEEHKRNLSISRKGKYSGKNSKLYVQLTDDTIEKILDLRNKGLSYFKICDATGIKYEKVRKTIKERENHD